MVIGGLLVVGLVILFISMNNGSSSEKVSDNSVKSVVSNSNSQASDNSNSQNVKTFDMTAKDWEFSMNKIAVSQGDKVVINLKSMDVEHGFYLPDFSINQKLIPGDNVKVEFTADKKGTFTFKCNVPCGEGHREMTGTITVA